MCSNGDIFVNIEEGPIKTTEISDVLLKKIKIAKISAEEIKDFYKKEVIDRYKTK